ncbi:hypothetical protein H4S00_006424, partial [Coemansia sp. D1744]
MRQLSLRSTCTRLLGAAAPAASPVHTRQAASRFSGSLLTGNAKRTNGLVLPLTRSVRFYTAQADKEPAVQSGEKHEFKAETKKLLHIVAHSLYSQREVFVRELISNASDALEKLRQLQATSADVSSEKPLGIDISIDADSKTITFQDTGIGMNAEELKENLGTIARSGSKAYIEKMQSSDETKDAANTIVGQFGVGFYSAFMVGDKITVYTRSAKPDSEGYCWDSDGLGSYTLSKTDNVPVGTKITISVKDDAK